MAAATVAISAIGIRRGGVVLASSRAGFLLLHVARTVIAPMQGRSECEPWENEEGEHGNEFGRAEHLRRAWRDKRVHKDDAADHGDRHGGREAQTSNAAQLVEHLCLGWPMKRTGEGRVVWTGDGIKEEAVPLARRLPIGNNRHVPNLKPEQHLPDPDPQRPRIAVLPFVATPYQVHLARRLATELPEVEFVFLYADESPDQGWKIDLPPEVTAVEFQTGCPPVGQARTADQPRFFRRGGMLIEWIRRNGARALVCYGHNDLGRLRLARWCGRKSVPYFLAADSNALLDQPQGWKRWVKDAYMRVFLGRAAGVMVFGRRGTEYFARYGIPASRSFYVPYEPDYAELASVTEADVAAARQEFGLGADRRRIVFCGRLLGLKRVDLLIDAFARIAAERPEWDVALIGDGPERAALESRVHAALKGRFRWLGFQADAKKIGAIYRCCDVLTLQSDYEAWGLVVNEAMFYGLAVATSNIVGAAAHLVREGEPSEGGNGRIFPRGDSAAMARALLELTEPGKIEGFKANSPPLLAAYRREADPALGMRKALESAGVLGGGAG